MKPPKSKFHELHASWGGREKEFNKQKGGATSSKGSSQKKKINCTETTRRKLTVKKIDRKETKAAHKATPKKKKTRNGTKKS